MCEYIDAHQHICVTCVVCGIRALCFIVFVHVWYVSAFGIFGFSDDEHEPHLFVIFHALMHRRSGWCWWSTMHKKTYHTAGGFHVFITIQHWNSVELLSFYQMHSFFRSIKLKQTDLIIYIYVWRDIYCFLHIFSIIRIFDRYISTLGSCFSIARKYKHLMGLTGREARFLKLKIMGMHLRTLTPETVKQIITSTHWNSPSIQKNIDIVYLSNQYFCCRLEWETEDCSIGNNVRFERYVMLAPICIAMRENLRELFHQHHTSILYFIGNN